MKTVVENVLDLAEEAGEPKKKDWLKILAILPKSSKKMTLCLNLIL